MTSEKVDVAVVGAGIAGLGVAAQLAGHGLKVLCFEQGPQAGGRLQSFSYNDPRGDGWRLDIGLHMTELGDRGAASALCRRVGGAVSWPPFSESVQFFHDGVWKDVAELVPLSDDDKKSFKALLRLIASLTDEAIDSEDDVSWKDWMDRQGLSAPLRKLFSLLSMIMTTLPHPSEQAAGEVLFIARENLREVRQVLSANYPIGGMDAIIRLLREALEAGGGEVVLNCAVQEVLIEAGAVRGVRIPKTDSRSPYPPEFRVDETETIRAETVVCAVPTYHLHRVLDLHPERTPLPLPWVRRIRETAGETTGLIGYILGLEAPITTKRCFFSALALPNTGLPFQAFPASTYDPSIAPEGKQLLHTDCVVDREAARDPFTVRRTLEALRRDLDLLFPGIEERTLFRIPYRTDGCDGLARKPGIVGRYKPDVEAPGVRGLFFAGDTYRGRGLAMNGAARSAMLCADRIVEKGRPSAQDRRAPD